MTYATKSRRGFTLLELVLVMGIITVLMGLLFPALSSINRKANAARVHADLNTIATALRMYKDDFQGSYPQVFNVNPVNGELMPGNGAYTLCKALFALGPAYPASITDVGSADGADGAGFRLRRTVDDGKHPRYEISGSAKPPYTLKEVTGKEEDDVPDSFGGRVYGPYLKPESFRFDTDANFRDFDRIRVLDHSGSPILYYNASKPNVNLASASAPLIAWRFNPYPQTPEKIDETPKDKKTQIVNTKNYRPMFNVWDNDRDVSIGRDGAPNQVDFEPLLVMLGDSNGNNVIDGDETATLSEPFLLWTRGRDNRWGPDGVAAGDANVAANRLAVDKCDDITNFR